MQSITLTIKGDFASGDSIAMQIESSKTVKDLKDKLESQMAENRRISPSAMKLVFNGALLGPDTKPISEIQNLANNSTVTLLKVQNIEVRNGPPPTQQSTNDDQTDAVRSRLNNCRILQRNFESCVDAAQTSKEPCERARYNEAATPTPLQPSARDFGYLVKDMANSLRTWSFQLHRLSDQLIRDEPLPDKNAPEYETARRLIQNNMDASRYMSPELQHFCQFVIPLGDEPPRGLATMNRTGSSSSGTQMRSNANPAQR